MRTLGSCAALTLSILALAGTSLANPPDDDPLAGCLSLCTLEAPHCAVGAAPAATARINGTYVGNATNVCAYTSTSGGTTTSNTQTAGNTGKYYFDGAGGLYIDLINNAFNVPAGTRNTSHLEVVGAYAVCDDDTVVTNNCSCGYTMDGAGSHNIVRVPSILGRFLITGDELFRFPAGPPAEEHILTTLAPGNTGPTEQWRKCSRVGGLRRVPGGR
jgi:hypothetical protein